MALFLLFAVTECEIPFLRSGLKQVNNDPIFELNVAFNPNRDRGINVFPDCMIVMSLAPLKDRNAV